MAKKSGLLVSLILGVIALILGSQFPLLGPSLIAIILGVVLNNSLGVPNSWEVGLTFASKKLLQWAIIVLGFTFSISEVSEVGLSSLQISLLTIAIAFITSYFLGKRLRMRRILTLLIGFGTAICGGSAIAAASPILEADDDDIAIAISTIFFFNVMAVFLFPFFGHLLHMSNSDFGLWSGTAINDTSSVVAAAYTYSQQAGDYATIVKLARALMIIPACLLMAVMKYYGQRKKAMGISVKQLFPWFILWFVLASVVSSLGWIPINWIPYIKKVSQLLMAMALVGIGTNVSIASFKKAGMKPLVLGLLTWMAVALSSLFLQYVVF